MSKIPIAQVIPKKSIKNARIVYNLPHSPVFDPRGLNTTPFSPFNPHRSEYNDALEQYNRNVANYIERYNQNLERVPRTAQEIPIAVRKTFLNKIKSWFNNRRRGTRRNNRIAPAPFLREAPIYRTISIKSGKKSRKKKRLKRKKTKRRRFKKKYKKKKLVLN